MCLDMPRKRFPITIDTRLIDGVKEAAGEIPMSINAYMEELLMGHLKSIGKLPMDTTPLPEARGGKRVKGQKAAQSEEGKADD